MPLSLPKISRAGAHYFMACGMLDAPSPRVRSFIKKQPDDWNVFQERGSRQFVRWGLSVSKNDTLHCHVDVATPDYFPRSKPKSNSSKSGMDSAFANLLGTKVRLSLRTSFWIDPDAVPAFIQDAMRIGVEHDAVRVKATQGKFSVAGAPISTIEWSFDDDDTRVLISLDGELDSVVSESYVENAFESIESGIEIFLTEGERP